MTDVRPERARRPDEPYAAQGAYDDTAAFEAAVRQLDDPLTDPLPGRPPARSQPSPEASRRTPAQDAARGQVPGQAARPAGSDGAGSVGPAGSAGPQAGRQGSPWFRPHQPPAPNQAPSPSAEQPVASLPPQSGTSREGDAPPGGHAGQDGHEEQKGATAYAGPGPDAYGAQGAAAGSYAYGTQEPGVVSAATVHAQQERPRAGGSPGDTAVLPRIEEPPAADRTRPVSRETGPPLPVSRETDLTQPVSRETTGVSRETEASGPPIPGGRAARRKAAQQAAKRGGKRGHSPQPPTPAPASRLEARRAERAAKDGPGVILSRFAGELFITLGVLMLLFVTYQLWWTNLRANWDADGTTQTLEQEWDKGDKNRDAGVFSPGQGFAIMYIPKLDVKVPIAEGISKAGVLDRGMVGHYGEDSLKTAMPWDKQGNFAVAGHRNTHGEPFRYINRLTKGDKIIVETRDRFYTYEMTSILPQTTPSNIRVVDPVPKGSGFTGPGRYITLTTCTPEFTSTYRMIVWGKMVEERPRSEGKPDALVS
ncbi:class E sortase [Streptomyces sp. NPDC003077]|uniref:class E sortase n=1 Tax=Streptomyces sp. NPDC003077 TaxID=3154443 RepID=UPI0033B09F50